MLDGYHGRHAVPYIGSGKIGILFFQDTDGPGIIVHDLGKGRFESGQVRSAFCVVNVIAEAQHVFPEFIDILESDLHLNAVRLAFQQDRIMDNGRIPVQILQVSDDALGLVVFFRFDFVISSVFIMDGQFGIQIRRLVKPAFDLGSGKSGLFKDLGVRKKIDRRSR